MIPTSLDDFREIRLVDFEFCCPDGETPTVVCMVARELRSGRLQRLWWDMMRHFERPPFPIDSGVLYVAYYASAEMLCHLSYDWPMPVYVLDLFTEFRCLTNGRAFPGGRGLIGALRYHGIDSIAVEEKTEMRELAMREGPHTGSDRWGCSTTANRT
jgi:DNA polymerase-1